MCSYILEVAVFFSFFRHIIKMKGKQKEKGGSCILCKEEEKEMLRKFYPLCVRMVMNALCSGSSASKVEQS